MLAESGKASVTLAMGAVGSGQAARSPVSFPEAASMLCRPQDGGDGATGEEYERVGGTLGHYRLPFLGAEGRGKERTGDRSDRRGGLGKEREVWSLGRVLVPSLSWSERATDILEVLRFSLWVEW